MAEGSVGIPAEGVPGRVGAWWRVGGRGGSAAHVVTPVGVDAGDVMRRVHEGVPGSVLVDAAGLTAEQVMHNALVALGFDLSPGKRDDWRFALGSWPEERLLVLVNAERAGLTRRSYEPERLVTWVLPLLARGKLAVLTDTGPGLLPRSAPPENVFRLADPAGGVPAPDMPDALRALALAEPRNVPLPVWGQLVSALTGETRSAEELTALTREHAELLVVGPLGVSFAEERVAEALRRQVDSGERKRVNRHLVDWLLRTSVDLRHPEGWARTGAVGLYAAAGLAMHAVQAGVYEELLRDGRMVAQLPQTALMDSARSRSYLIPGNSPAADAIHLWEWGVVPKSQREWASWLHVMAWSRGDQEFAHSVASSGVSLLWRTKWAHWRPPGGYHPRFLEAGRFVRLAEVRWQGRPALAGLQLRTVDGAPDAYVSVRDMDTGELIAGPWEEEEIPPEDRTDLALPPASPTASDTESDDDCSGPPTRLSQLFPSPAPRRENHAFLLPCVPLAMGNTLVFGGSPGLIALQPTDAMDFSGTFGSLQQPLSRDYADAGPSSPVDATPPSHRDLISLFGEDDIWESEPEDIPEELTHRPTREFLTEFGLPDMREGAMALLPYGDWEVDLFDEVDWPNEVDPVAERGPFFQIGRWMGGELVIDGPTGHILRIPTGPDEEHLAGLPAACGLEKFLTMVALYVTGIRTRALLPPGSSERGQIPYWVLSELTAIDEKGGEQPAWAYVLHNE
ncbi:SUKH-4 family immunity protein [Streptomyces catenulae]|uniref:SUKH-4 family immunity protein n=1 Tax=Streptomyces catenulae TaxID=66875 RepID=A0ABV2YW23_9ACTN|nr:SUKH-4 family immunity protein [Streptomyces catenulae]